MKIDKDWVEAYFEHGVDVKNRRVFLDRDIDDESAAVAIRGLYLMETDSPTKQIEIFISTLGGCVYEMFGIFDIMNTVKCPIHTFAYSKCMSAGLLILAAGTQGHRWVAPNLALMHHDVQLATEGSRSQVASEIRHYEKYNNKRLDLLGELTKKPGKWWRQQARKSSDVFFSAEDAIEWGLADHIWVEK